MADSYNHSNILAGTCGRCSSQNETASHFERARQNSYSSLALASVAGSLRAIPATGATRSAVAPQAYSTFELLVSQRVLRQGQALGVMAPLKQTSLRPGKSAYSILEEPSRLLEQQCVTAKFMPTFLYPLVPPYLACLAMYSCFAACQCCASSAAWSALKS
jgi:hypothetical protein